MTDTATAAEPVPPPFVEPESSPTPPPRKRTWTMPKSPVTRQQADAIGRTAGRTVVRLGAELVRMLAGVARWTVRVVRQLGGAIEDIPPALRLIAVLAVLGLLGIVGSVALQGSPKLICAVVVVPVCLIAVGALGHRWYVGQAGVPAQRADAPEAAPSELRRSIEYVDTKLALVMESFGGEHHQQAVIALVQAKTALEFALGTEGQSASRLDLAFPSDDRAIRPRIRPGLAPQSALREGTSLAAS